MNSNNTNRTLTEEELTNIVWTGGGNFPQPFDPQKLYEPHPDSDAFEEYFRVGEQREQKAQEQPYRDACADLKAKLFGPFLPDEEYGGRQM